MLIGGFAQFIVTWLIQQTGSPMAPTYYVMFGVALGLTAALMLGGRADQEVSDPASGQGEDRRSKIVSSFLDS